VSLITIDSLTDYYDATYENKIDYNDFVRPVLITENGLKLADYLKITVRYPKVARSALMEKKRRLRLKLIKRE
jgi:hypothetical protein